jgi:DNA-binding XRE family transcriptional regulator
MQQRFSPSRGAHASTYVSTHPAWDGALRRRGPELLALGAAVRELRARRGLSQEALGFRAGLHRNYVGAVERGEINPTFRVLLKTMRGTDLPLSELIALYERNIREHALHATPPAAARRSPARSRSAPPG